MKRDSQKILLLTVAVSKIFKSVFKNFEEFTKKKTQILESLCNKVTDPLPESLIKKTPAQIFFCEIFTQPVRVTTSGSSGRYLKTYQNDIKMTLMLTLNVFLSFAITSEATIQNKLRKSWRFSREMSVGEFHYSMKL